MDEFDQNFEISVTDEFTVHFKDPKLYSDDFISLSKLQPSEITQLDSGKKWRYWFRKVDQQGNVIQPEIKFYFDLKFNAENRLIEWIFSSLFLQIAPAEFLEISFRSLGSAEINKETRQLRANTDLVEKISSDLPKKTQILSQLGEPIKIKDKKTLEKYYYHFLLQTKEIENGYEDRTLNIVKLTFDKTSTDLVKMSGRFAGLKVSIDYRKYLENTEEHLAQIMEIDK
jgi:predicted phage tail protein